MKYLTSVFSLIFLFMASSLSAQSKANKPAAKSNDYEIIERDGVKMLEINPRELPEEVHRDILNNFHNAEIQNAYKVWQPGAKEHEFWVDILQGAKKWSLQFDAQGDALNKIKPSL